MSCFAFDLWVARIATYPRSSMVLSTNYAIHARGLLAWQNHGLWQAWPRISIRQFCSLAPPYANPCQYPSAIKRPLYQSQVRELPWQLPFVQICTGESTLLSSVIPGHAAARMTKGLHPNAGGHFPSRCRCRCTTTDEVRISLLALRVALVLHHLG